MDSDVEKRTVLISVRNVSFSFGLTPVLVNINLPIYKGDFLAVLGPNGSGKTTLLRIILGLLKPNRGEVRIMGETQQEFSDWGKIGYVPQKATHFDPYFPASVQEVVAMGIRADMRSKQLSRRDEESVICKALGQVGMEEFKDWRVGKLSGGQQQRVFIARAVVNSPGILFLDEPTTGVDANTHDQFYDMLADLNRKEEITIVLVTHETGIVNKHVTRVACLNQKLIYHGSHEEFCRSQAFKQMLEGGHHLIGHRH